MDSAEARGQGGDGDGFEGLEVEFLRGVVDVNADDVAFRVEVDDQAVGDFARVGAGPGIEVDIQGVGFRIVVELHTYFPSSLMVA